MADMSPGGGGVRRGPGERREPIHSPWFWAWLGFLLLAGVPWYLPLGSVHPVLWGVPYWVWLSVGLSLVFGFSIRWGCLRLWRVGGGDAPPVGERPDGE